jgi:hypothetical protein
MLELGNEMGDRVLKKYVVFPKRVVRVDEQVLPLGRV